LLADGRDDDLGVRWRLVDDDGRPISLNLDRSPQPAVIKADVAQIRQVLMNLVLNAAEAIGEEPGSIAIRTSTVQPTPAELAEVIWQPKSTVRDYVQIEVTDSGCGMSKETQEKIFEPFFSTKFTGRGLGLSAVLGILKAHDGLLKISSQIGQGTTFKILLPLVEGGSISGSSILASAHFFLAPLSSLPLLLLLV
jgi:signal transduction histidine kinase